MDSQSCNKTCPKAQGSEPCTESCALYDHTYKCCSFVTLAESSAEIREILWNWFKKLVEPFDL